MAGYDECLFGFQPTAAAMFEHACSDRIHQFDTTDSDEELWEDKEMTFNNLSDVRHRCVNDAF